MQMTPILIFYFFSIVLPIFLLSILRQKLLHGNPDAKHLSCRLGFHQTKMQRFDGNDYVNREICDLCGYTIPHS